MADQVTERLLERLEELSQRSANLNQELMDPEVCTNPTKLMKINKEIGNGLELSDKTVKNYLSNIFTKLNISRRAEAATYFARQRSLDPGKE